jgi:hypothetical protein
VEEKSRSRKIRVIEHLFARYEAGQIPNGIVTSNLLASSIRKTKSKLSTKNTANFLKDIVRSKSANSLWPTKLREARLTARQRYGGQRVFQFIPYSKGQSEPFPDRFPRNSKTRTHRIQSASMSFASRRLGRSEETWFVQLVVNLRLVESQLALYSPLRHRLRDVTHLQNGLKTQPEIDAVFLASFGKTADLNSPTELHMLLTCEAKGSRERILEDQIKEQIAIAMRMSGKINSPQIDAVKPIAIEIVQIKIRRSKQMAIRLIEFRHIARKSFLESWDTSASEDNDLYSLPLEVVSDTVYIVEPRVEGLHV